MQRQALDGLQTLELRGTGWLSGPHGWEIESVLRIEA
jgi:hypothetical protein